jgi:hypothetical protein
VEHPGAGDGPAKPAAGSGQNRIDIALYGYPQEGLVLEPFHFGQARLLAPHYNWRFHHQRRNGALQSRFHDRSRASCSASSGSPGAANRSTRVLATSCAFACIICIHFGFDTSVPSATAGGA